MFKNKFQLFVVILATSLTVSCSFFVKKYALSNEELKSVITGNTVYLTIFENEAAVQQRVFYFTDNGKVYEKDAVVCCDYLTTAYTTEDNKAYKITNFKAKINEGYYKVEGDFVEFILPYNQKSESLIPLNHKLIHRQGQQYLECHWTGDKEYYDEKTKKCTGNTYYEWDIKTGDEEDIKLSAGIIQ